MVHEKRELNALSVKVDVDIAEAIRGLKAVQREAKKATQALRELENRVKDAEKSGYNPVYYVSGLRDYSTEDLRTEIAYREVVEVSAE